MKLDSDQALRISQQARKWAHTATKRCRGGDYQGQEHKRWHTPSCDQLAELLEAFAVDRIENL